MADPEPEGHTLLLALDGNLVINRHTIEKLASFNPMRGLSAVGKIGDSTINLVAKRSPTFPEVQTFAENGVKDFDANSWVGLMAPPGTPAAVINKLNSELNAILAGPEVQSKLHTIGINGTPWAPQAFAKVIESDFALFGKVVKTAGIKVD